MNFTDEQLKVIETKNKNILVSAAAGSGKTAVLVERIIQKVLDKDAPVDIDRILVVTFTEAAAAEMKERIGKAIEERLKEDPENEHLQKQSALLYKAQISTIHSFCLNIIRNNFNKIGLDPGFRIADSTELKLMEDDVLNGLFEELYDAEDEDFLKTVDYFSHGVKDTELKDIILDLYNFSQGYPWPDDWLDQCAQSYNITDDTEFNSSEWMKYLRAYTDSMLNDAVNMALSLKEFIVKNDMGEKYLDMVNADIDVIRSVMSSSTYDEYKESLSELSFVRKPSKGKSEIDDGLTESLTMMRDSYKNILTGKKADSLRKFYEFSSKDEIQKAAHIYPYVNNVVSLTKTFAARYKDERVAKGIISFSDMEHYAIDILYTTDGEGNRIISDEAEAYKNMYDEILMDEYQDCNRVQELLIKSVSSDDEKKHNRFMVGDVKQSIYKFRLANPELFIEKYDSYETDDSDGQRTLTNLRINLHRNFRSRQNVINTVNDLFGQIMKKEVGGVEYDEDASLVYGELYGEDTLSEYDTEIDILEKDNDSFLTKGEQEAKLIASLIGDIVGKLKVTDKVTHELRPAKYSDIVILLRSMTDVASGLKDVLSNEGIPFFMNLSSGFYETKEINEIVQFLKVLDNPRQDIPLYGVMHSYFGGFEDEEIAAIRVKGKENGKTKRRAGSLYENLLSVAEEDTRVRTFLGFIEKYRKKSTFTPIHTLIRELVDETGYADHVNAMTGGTQRKANVNLLIAEAIKFEKTSFKGLFHFVRYLGKIRQVEADLGEADVMDENADVVRIMTIHKSKGLEYPVCILAGSGKQFNMSDTRGMISLDMDLGIGASLINTSLHIKNTPLFKKVINLKIKQDLLGEELRVLYVAMTRAKEKLIITSVTDDGEALLEKVEVNKGLIGPEGVSYSYLSGCKSYMDFMLPLSDIYNIVSPDDLIMRMAGDAARRLSLRIDLENDLNSNRPLGDIKKDLLARMDKKYAHPELENLILKTSVSELKKAYLDMEMTKELFPEAVPIRKKEKGVMTGTDRGSAYHKVMELLDFNDTDIKSQIDNMIKKQLISNEWAEAVDIAKIEKFLEDPLAARMALAQKKGCLKKEQPFVLGIDASRVDKNYPKGETVLLQGIIDAFFIEDDEIVLVDYKTDVIRSGEELMKRYHVQLEYYKEALQNILGLRVKESILYSFSLGCHISDLVDSVLDGGQ